MRILHVTDTYYPAIGGLERSVRTLAHYQQNVLLDEVAVLTAEHSSSPALETDNNVTIFRVPMLTQRVPGALLNKDKAFHPTMRDPLFSVKARQIIQDFQPDIIHTHGWNIYSILSKVVNQGVPILATAHDYGHVCATKIMTLPDGSVCSGPGVKKCLQHSLQHYGVKGVPISMGISLGMNKLRKADWTALSSTVRDAGQENTRYSIPDIAVIPSYTPDSVLEPPQGDKPYWIANEPYLLFVGALNPEKGLLDTIQAHQEFTKSTNIPLLLLGTRQQLTPDISEYENITMLTDIPHNEVMHAWAHAYIGLAPSNLPESFGQVVVEALASRTPLISTNHGGPSEIITSGSDGILVPPNSPDKILEALLDLHENSEKREKLAKNGYETAKLYTVKSVAPRIREQYEKTIRRI